MTPPDYWNQCIRCLILVRLGQELGTDSPLTRAVHDLVLALVGLLS